MKEQTIIQEFQKAQKERMQNNTMIQMHDSVLRELQQFTIGMLEVMREMPGYKKALAEVAERREEEAKKAKEEAKLDLDVEASEGGITDATNVDPAKVLDIFVNTEDDE